MTLQADVLVDRRRLKRQLGVWRLIAILLVVGLLAVLAFRSDDVTDAVTFKPHIARVTVSGLIQDDREQFELIEKIGKSKQVAAVIVAINSPGGTTTGGEGLYNALQRLKEKKPVVAVMGTIATSAAYLTAIATDRIVARSNTITGSVGVIFQWAEVTDLLKTLGVKVEEIKSGQLKAVPSPFQPLNEEGRRVTQEMVEESKQWFVGLVGKERAFDPKSVPGLTEGRVYSGRVALDLKLVDEIGDEKTAIAWLEDKRGVAKSLRVVDWKKEQKSGYGLLGSAGLWLARLLGLDRFGFVSDLLDAAASRGRLDGLVSLWHPRSD